MIPESGEESAEDADRSREDRARQEFQVAVWQREDLSIVQA